MRWIDEEKPLYPQLESMVEKDIVGLDKNNLDSDKMKQYKLNQRKLLLIPTLAEKQEKFQKRYIEFIDYLNRKDDFSESKLDCALTLASCFTYLSSNVVTLSDDELAILTTVLSKIPLEDYSAYGYLIGDGRILKAICKKTNSFSNQIEIAYEILEFMGEDFITMTDALAIIEQMPIEETKNRREISEL